MFWLSFLSHLRVVTLGYFDIQLTLLLVRDLVYINSKHIK